ncbi:MAG: accessory gene regulator B family protein [Clostridia bacterium]|nr:accessory gene regulator B family protein [Clostridia bacterium]
MIDNICMFLTKKIRKEMPEIDDERAEVINYGLQNLIGEFPKIFIVIGVACVLGILKETLLSILIIMPYRIFSGGFHLKTHIGCIIGTTLFYCGTAFIGKYIVIEEFVKYSLIALTWIFGMIMVKLYAPADTENVPILRKKDRKQKQIMSFCILTVFYIVALLVPNSYVANIIIFGYFIQSITITRVAYKLTNNRYGYEVYNTSNELG